MKRYVVWMLSTGLLLFVGALGCRPGAQPDGEPSADTAVVERGRADFQPKGPSGVEVGVAEAGAESATPSASWPLTRPPGRSSGSRTSTAGIP